MPVAVAGTVFAFACGSSSVHAVNQAGKPLRWAMLAVLLAVAAAWAVTSRRRALPSASVIVSALFFLGLALISGLWSVDPRLTVARAGSLAVLFAAAALLASAAAGRPEEIDRILAGVLGAATAVALAGLVVLAADRHAAVQSATRGLPWRYQGLGENPNTVALLLSLALPIAVWFAARARSPIRRAALLGVVLLLDGSIVASQSRGALVAGFVGTAIVVALLPLSGRVRAVVAVCALAVLGVSVGLALVPKPNPSAPSAAPAPAAPTSAPLKPSGTHRYVNAESDFPLDFEIGNRVPGVNTSQPRSFLGSSGRSIAWRGALDLADERPVLGYGFGTESHVFVDRYALFTSGTPENSYIGLDLQLGAVGLAAFLALAAAIVVAAARRLGRTPAAVCVAVFVSALVLAIVQSYVYSVGNIGTATAWICAFLAAAAPVRSGAEQ